jgi:hypothetical protein
MKINGRLKKRENILILSTIMSGKDMFIKKDNAMYCAITWDFNLMKALERCQIIPMGAPVDFH